MYKIFDVDMSRATGNNEIGYRPVVCVKVEGSKAYVFKITKRNKNMLYHARMNPYMIYGYCCVSMMYIIDRKYLKKYKRDCTRSECDGITSQLGRMAKITPVQYINCFDKKEIVK